MIKLQIEGPIRYKTDQQHWDFSRSTRAPSGTIYLVGHKKSSDGGRTLQDVPADHPIYRLLPTGLCRSNIVGSAFLGLGYHVLPVSSSHPGLYQGDLWRGSGDLADLEKSVARFILPEGGCVSAFDERQGLFCYNQVVTLRDGSLLVACFGNFEGDCAVPTHPQALEEVAFKMRTFVMRSTDGGETWRYRSTVARSDGETSDDTEGFDEPAMLRLDNGDILVVMRRGHYASLAACWSHDDGETWTSPRFLDELGDGGCDPCLIRLTSGRLALAFGRRGADGPGASRSCELAISPDGAGEQFVRFTIAEPAARTAYATIYEVEPDVIFYQSGPFYWRIRV